MKKAAAILFLSLMAATPVIGQNTRQYQYNNDIPSKNGIQHYVDLNKGNIIDIVENFISDTILSHNIKVDNLSQYQVNDSLEGGRFYPEDEIIISNDMEFEDYELSFVPRRKQKEFVYNTKFVKAVLIHELIHLYCYQFIYSCLENNIQINAGYLNFSVFPGIITNYSSEFVEEGICEYVVMKLGEGIFADSETLCRESNGEAGLSEFILNQDKSSIKYQYSRIFVQKIFENNPFKDVLFVIFTTNPPTYEELLCPDKYYTRLLKHAHDSGFEDFRIL